MSADILVSVLLIKKQTKKKRVSYHGMYIVDRIERNIEGDDLRDDSNKVISKSVN